MIIDRLTNSHLYFALHPRLPAAFEYLERTDLAQLAVGRYEIDGPNMYAMLQEYETKQGSEGIWESHRRYIDLQVMLCGSEKIGYASISQLTQGGYEPAKDFLPLFGEGDFLTLRSGNFMLLFPEDGHMPGIAIDSPAPVRKIVVKIPVL